LGLPDRKLNRLKGYDYSNKGAYFLTVCTYEKHNLFGKIIDGDMFLNNAGEMIKQTQIDTPQYYSNIAIDCYCIMPNHVHVIVLVTSGTPQGAFPTMSIPQYIDRFKTLTTKKYIDGVKRGIYKPFDKHIWQKSYYDHIIRGEQEYLKICEYIQNNPLTWEIDKYYKTKL